MFTQFDDGEGELAHRPTVLMSCKLSCSIRTNYTVQDSHAVRISVVLVSQD